MKNKSNILSIGLVGFILSGVNPSLAAKNEGDFDSVKIARMEHWKQSPHTFWIGCGTLLSPESHNIYTQMALNTSMAYQYDIPWQHQRTNFFVTAGVGYEGCRRNDKPYRAKNDIVYENYIYDNFHIFLGTGLKVRLTYFLDLSFSAAIDGSFSYEIGRYPSFYGTGIQPPLYDVQAKSFRVSRNPTFRNGIQGLFSIALTYEIKNFRIFAGCQAYMGYLNDLEKMRSGFDEPHAMPFRSWAVFGIGYRLSGAARRKIL